MKYLSTLPITALVALSLISLLVSYDVIPPGLAILEDLKSNFGDYFFLMIFLIILAESIIYVGFYFPGQFFAVVLVVLSKPDASDIGLLTIAMVTAATLGSLINFFLGKKLGSKPSSDNSISMKQLLLAMIHINSLAFFMFSQGAKGQSVKIVGLAGLLNLPYYLVLITGTAVLSEEVMQIAENTILLFSLITIWLAISIYLDWKKHWKEEQCSQS
ncbi:MAG: hypothetical protein HWE27_06775 [Gammaproteobacteria bacterium]|nr:hypothetical protein [Gammaproteobacteria bacterium]